MASSSSQQRKLSRARVFDSVALDTASAEVNSQGVFLFLATLLLLALSIFSGLVNVRLAIPCYITGILTAGWILISNRFLQQWIMYLAVPLVLLTGVAALGNTGVSIYLFYEPVLCVTTSGATCDTVALTRNLFTGLATIFYAYKSFLTFFSLIVLTRILLRWETHIMMLAEEIDRKS
jgi:hypothetical protein